MIKKTWTILKENRDIHDRWYHPEGIRKWMRERNDVFLLGQLGHGVDTKISLDLVSHKFDNLRWDGIDFLGDLTILKTPNGMILQKMIDEDVNFRTSLRSIGTLSKSGLLMVAHVTELCAIDLVPN